MASALCWRVINCDVIKEEFYTGAALVVITASFTRLIPRSAAVINYILKSNCGNGSIVPLWSVVL